MGMPPPFTNTLTGPLPLPPRWCDSFKEIEFLLGLCKFYHRFSNICEHEQRCSLAVAYRCS